MWWTTFLCESFANVAAYHIIWWIGLWTSRAKVGLLVAIDNFALDIGHELSLTVTFSRVIITFMQIFSQRVHLPQTRTMRPTHSVRSAVGQWRLQSALPYGRIWSDGEHNWYLVGILWVQMHSGFHGRLAGDTDRAANLRGAIVSPFRSTAEIPTWIGQWDKVSPLLVRGTWLTCSNPLT